MSNAITHLFSNLVLAEFSWEEFGQYKKSLIDYCLEKEKPNTVESNIAPSGKFNLWESSFNFFEDDHPSVVALKLWIIKSCERYINLLNNSNYKFIITDSWAHVTREHGYHLPHYHPNSSWSGIFYIDSQPGTLGKNHWLMPYNIEKKPGLEFINDSISSNAESGKLILFPSMVTHYAEPYTGVTPRIVIAFNAKCR